MIGSFVIVFREILEAALVIGIVAAAVKGLPHRGRWISLGVAIGIIGASLVAAGIGVIASFAHGNGQEIFEACVLFGAGLMLAWHNIYMARHGRKLGQKLETMGQEVLTGSTPLVMLIGVTVLAVMREGSEIALFLYGIAAAGVTDLSLLGGSLLGLVAGVTAGFVLFAGLSRISVQRLFQASGWLILFIAAGMIARGAQFLIQAGYLPPLVNTVWNSSSIISGNGILGRALGALAGYTPAPSLMQILFWIASFVGIGAFMLGKSGRLAFLRRRRAEVTVMLLAAGGFLLVPHIARAGDYQVYSPNVVLGESEIEARAYNSWDTGPQTGSSQALKFSFAHAFTDWWATELYVTSEKEYGETLKFEEIEWENRFQLTPQGKYWVNVGLINENEIPRYSDDPYVVKFGPTLGKDYGRFSALLNLLATHEYGSNARNGVGLEYRVRLTYRWHRSLSPMVEAYGEPVGQTGAGGRSRHQIGPGVTGQVRIGPRRSLRYGAVALFGTGSAAPGATLVLRLEYEFY